MQTKYLIFYLLLPFSLFSQGVTPTLNKFLDSEFFKKFESMKSKCEESMIGFNDSKQQFTYEEGKIVLLNKSYDNCVSKFNGIIENVIADLMNKKKRKEIARDTEKYSESLSEQLKEAEIEYNKFSKTIDDVSNHNYSNIDITPSIFSILNVIEQSVRMFIDLKKEFALFQESNIRAKLKNTHMLSSDELNQ